MFIHELERSGQWLFRWRSYLPLVLLPFALLVVATHREYLANSPAWDFIYKLGCLLISLVGLLVRAVTLGYAQEGSSGRNTREQIADALNTAGLYSVCRHPLYLGNMLMALGLLLFTKSLLLATAGMLAYLLLYERIIATEERFLANKFGETFEAWSERVPLLIPRFSQWVQPNYPFHPRAAIKGEFYGLTAIAASMMLLDTTDRWFIERRLVFHPFWLWFFAASLVLFFILRYIRKHTTLFEVSRKTRNGT
jgi:protein-S-isoprenylcysteine O-methyltransferase Ste14